MLSQRIRNFVKRVNANIGRSGPPRARRFRVVDGHVVEVSPESLRAARSMFPYASTAMSVRPEEVRQTAAYLRAHGIHAEFDSQGRLIVTSSRMQRKAAKALGMFDPARGYGYIDAEGRFQKTGRGPEEDRRHFVKRIKGDEAWHRLLKTS